MQNSITTDGWQQFINRCNKLNRQELEIFFELFLTLSEREEIANRFQIVKELLAGKNTQREIAKNLHVSIANVSRGSNVLKGSSHNIKKLLNLD